MASRISRLQKQFDKLAIDAFLVTNQKNIFYLTGFDLMEGDGCLLVTKDRAIIITDARYQLALEEFDSDEVVATISQDYYGDLNKICLVSKITVLGYEDTISYRLFDLLDELMEAAIVPFTNLIEKMRMIKDSTEIAKLERAAKLHDEGYQFAFNEVHAGMTERELANRLDFWMKQHGASGESFPTIVASGENSAKPHATASDKVIEDGDIVTLDFGYYVDGYTADMTRTFAVGEVDDRLKEIYEIVETAMNRVIDKIKVGQTGDVMDHAGRDYIAERGYGENFNHGMGHGIGLDVHELPARYGSDSADLKFVNNEVITVEPGIYIEGLGGVRIEQDVIVTHNGPRVLTGKPSQSLPVTR
ncbi:MAG: Xaa-Pro peptidase family protein [Limosilactobacillus sp.]|uniref:M24 family metallopeptidase n=1 Tax=Limosilactobacillus sp. TaxID=2773925 RepID=UPI0027049432|nr:Xaa-Pro peptidase family protein [Limosilactobacillus sp.]